MNPLIISHASCPDGFAAAWLARRVWPESEIRFHQYDRDACPVADVKVGDSVIVVDFSYPRADMLALREALGSTGSLTVLDHHESAAKNCAGLDFCHFDQNRSGARMLRDFLLQSDLIPFDPNVWFLIDYIDDRDRWQWKLQGSREISDALASYGYDYEAWNDIVARNDPYRRLHTEGTVIRRFRQQQIAQLVAHGRPVTLARHRGMAVPCNLSNFISDVAGELAATPGAAFGACYFDDHTKGQRVWSLRARPADNPDSINVRELAEAFGGGGHANAAGFRVPL